MSIPSRTEMRLPLLKLLADGRIQEKSDLRTQLARDFALSAADLVQRTPNGKEFLFDYDAAWAFTDLKKAGLIEAPYQAHYRITETGLGILAQAPAVLDDDALMRIPTYQEYRAHKKLRDAERAAEAKNSPAPRTRLMKAVSRMDPDRYFEEERKRLIEEIRSRLFALSSKDFERLVVQLLEKMGYGVSQERDGSGLADYGDRGGISAVISEDKLGFSKIYIQTRRWAEDQVVSMPIVQQFYGALAATGAAHPNGLLITTTRFTADARDYAAKQNIVLIDGTKLSELMVAHELGVSTVKTYTLKALDADFFGGLSQAAADDNS